MVRLSTSRLIICSKEFESLGFSRFVDRLVSRCRHSESHPFQSQSQSPFPHTSDRLAPFAIVTPSRMNYAISNGHLHRVACSFYSRLSTFPHLLFSVATSLVVGSMPLSLSCRHSRWRACFPNSIASGEIVMSALRFPLPASLTRRPMSACHPLPRS